jgi:hypothetical protein
MELLSILVKFEGRGHVFSARKKEAEVDQSHNSE